MLTGLDFEKAFDIPPHGPLKSKLFDYDDGEKTISCIDSFLYYTTKRAVVHGETSVLASVLSSVPQETILIIYCSLCTLMIFPQDIDSEIRLFVDDCRIIRDTQDSLKLQKDIDRLGCWTRKSDMRFQPFKFYIMQINKMRTNRIEASYILEDTFLENVDSIKYLVVTITHDLRWNTHMSNMCTKANKTLGFLRLNLYQCPQDV